jgi:phosphomannomutase
MSIFKAYDIRGKYPAELDEAKAQAIGWAYVQLIKKNKKLAEPFRRFGNSALAGAPNIVVGRDARVSSPSLSASLIKGILQAGAKVTDIGLVTTPMSYFANGFYHFDGGIMVTASHNPAEYNGFKICREKAIAFSETTGLKDIENISRKFVANKSKNTKITKLDISKDYRNFIGGFMKIEGWCQNGKKIKVAVDTSNGCVGPIFNEIFRDLQAFKIFPLCFDVDGRFPNHEPNPMKDENIRDIIKSIKKNKADLGVAFDGDGDRVVFLDEKAGRIPNDLITVLIAKEILKEYRKAAIVYDLRSSRIVSEEVKSLGGRPVRERVGHAFIKATMRKNNAPFGGELSGHYYYRDNYFADNALITFVYLLNIMARENKPISRIINPFRKYRASGELNYEVADKEAMMKRIAGIYADGKIDYLDGVTVEYMDWWFNVRPSNTEPLLRLNIEASTAKQLESAKRNIEKILREA